MTSTLPETRCCTPMMERIRVVLPQPLGPISATNEPRSTLSVVGDWDGVLGHAQAIRLDSGGGFLEGGADPRGDGAALGY